MKQDLVLRRRCHFTQKTFPPKLKKLKENIYWTLSKLGFRGDTLSLFKSFAKKGRSFLVASDFDRSLRPNSQGCTESRGRHQLFYSPTFLPKNDVGERTPSCLPIPVIRPKWHTRHQVVGGDKVDEVIYDNVQGGQMIA